MTTKELKIFAKLFGKFMKNAKFDDDTMRTLTTVQIALDWAVENGK